MLSGLLASSSVSDAWKARDTMGSSAFHTLSSPGGGVLGDMMLALVAQTRAAGTRLENNIPVQRKGFTSIRRGHVLHLLELPKPSKTDSF